MDSIKSMASSSSSTVPPFERESHFVSQTEVEMESSKARHWSQLDYSTSDSEWSAESNFKDFALLKEDPQWGRFFKDFEALEVGKRISGGAQADIYEARMISKEPGPFNLVVKVMKGDVPLKAFQAQWPIGMLSARSKHKRLFDLPLIAILGGTVLRDQRLRGRFAFVMRRRWGDLRLLIDRRMKQEHNTRGPFRMDEAIHLMLTIAEDMDTLHNKHDILHRDLKAANVLVWGDIIEDMNLVATTNQVENIGSLVADFECSVGVLGSGFWRAPEILEQVKARVPCSKVRFTHASDVYSYGMTCYEIITGCIPYDGLGGEDTILQILQGQRPKLPHELPEAIRNIIFGCWHPDPLSRPSFSTIYMVLKEMKGPYLVSVVIDNKSKSSASIMKVEQWNILQALTLLEAMKKLMVMDLLVLKASNSSSTEMITQYFEVTDGKGKKVVNDKSIANFTKDMVPRFTKRVQIASTINENTIVQMHVVEVIVEGDSIIFEHLSRLFVEMNFRVHLARCWNHKGKVECVIYIEGARMGPLLWELRHNTQSFPTRYFKILIQRVVAEEFSRMSRCLHNLKSMDLTAPRCSPSNIRIHQRKESFESSSCTEVTMCLESRGLLLRVFGTLVDMNYKIFRASVKCPGSYVFLKGKANKTKDIDVGTLGEDESVKICRILDIATRHGCLEVNAQLIVSGLGKKLRDDWMKSLCENGLIVTGGQVHSDGWDFGSKLWRIPSGSFEYFVTEKSTMKIG